MPGDPSPVVGHYEILGEVGRGGMGVVFRARDLNLGREVALKRPGPDHAGHPEYRRRFLREARAVSSLSHPNIVPIFEVFEHDGVPWMAMELVDGGSLRDLLAGGRRFAVEEILHHAEGLGGALGAAHARRVLHRDVNPNNILMTADGRALLTDFGLARIQAMSGADSSGPTRSGRMTAPGRVMGTPGYMSPEQAQGDSVDSRTDIYSLGAVLYEMCTGKRAPYGTGPGEITGALSASEGGGSSVDHAVFEDLERIVNRSLAPLPADRYADAGQLVTEIKSARHRFEGGRFLEEHGADGPSGRPWTVPAWIVFAGIAAIGLSVILLFWRLLPSETPMTGASVASPLVTWPSQERHSRISPDGEWVSFISDREGRDQLWLRKRSGGEPRPIASPDGGVLGSVWSPNGEAIALLSTVGSGTRLTVVPAPLGGRSQRTIELQDVFQRVVRWIGSTVYLESRTDLWRLELASGSVEQLTTPDEKLEYRHRFDVRQDEGRIVFSGMSHGEENLWTADLRGGGSQRLTRDPHRAYGARWVGPQGDAIVFLSNRTGQNGLWRISLADGSETQIPFGGTVDELEDVSSDGSAVILRVVEENANLWRIESSTGIPVQLTAAAMSDLSPSPAEATTLVAFQRGKSGAGQATSLVDSGIILAELRPSGLVNERPLVDVGFWPRLSPDGRFVAHLRLSSREPYFCDLRAVDVNAGTERLVSESFQFDGYREHPAEVRGRNVVWSNRGPDLYFVAATDDLVPEIRRLRTEPAFEAGTEVLSAAASPGDLISDLDLSGDESRLSYVRVVYADSRWEVRVLELAGGEDRVVYSADVAVSSRGWLEGDRSLIVLRSEVNDDTTQRLEILEVSLAGGRHRVLGTAGRGYVSTARTDRATGSLFVTLVEDGIHNIYSLPLGGGRFERVTDNMLRGITFSGAENAGGAGWIFTRQEQNPDLWIVESR